jgi:hypothetical protein
LIRNKQHSVIAELQAGIEALAGVHDPSPPPDIVAESRRQFESA